MEDAVTVQREISKEEKNYLYKKRLTLMIDILKLIV